MENILANLTSQFVFWAAWIIIPLIMEIIPSLYGFLILVKKHIKHKEDKDLVYYPFITIIIPVYNSANTLRDCVDSIYDSDYDTDKMDIILVNNGSVDTSYEIYEEYQKEHPELNLTWMNAHQGKSKALNMALFNSEGKYIIHLDSDGVVHPKAINNLVKRFESHSDIHCMTGTILTKPEMIDDTQKFSLKVLRKVEFYEYAQAFLAGRNFEAESDSIFTMSGAFSAFRKSTILKTQLYNTETVCEDTHVTFQVRRLLKKKIDICENAVFYVEPIDNLDTLYVQRQRWQRGELEVLHMFPDKKTKGTGFFSSFISRLIMYDHTFAFPRMIWYFALICLTFMNYPFSFIVNSVVSIYILYCISAFLYYINIFCSLKWDKNLRKYYAKSIVYIFILPIFNFIVYWFRMAGIINSIKLASEWKTRSFKAECDLVKHIVKHDFRMISNLFDRLKKLLTKEE